MAITFKNADEMCLDLWENVDPFDIGRQQKSTGWSRAELRFRVERNKLLVWTISLVIGDQMTILPKDIALNDLAEVDDVCHDDHCIPPIFTKLSCAVGALKCSKIAFAAYSCKSSVFVVI